MAAVCVMVLGTTSGAGKSWIATALCRYYARQGFKVAPYKAPPKAPILYIKPRNTWAKSGDSVVVPSDVPELEMGATLGLVIGRTASKVSVADAMDHVAGYVVVNDISVPHDSFYRPSMRFKIGRASCRERVSSPV